MTPSLELLAAREGACGVKIPTLKSSVVDRTVNYNTEGTVDCQRSESSRFGRVNRTYQLN